MLLGACLAATLACASAPRTPGAADLAALAAADRAAADTRVLDGCYDCLIEAQATYERLAAGPARQGLLVPMFEVALLMALREKELALDSTATFARATALGAELPPALEAARHLAVVDAVPPNAEGATYVESRAFRQGRLKFAAIVDVELAWLAASPLRPEVREYLSLSIDCAYRDRRTPPGRATAGPVVRDVPSGTSPLVAYRLATCDAIKADVLADVTARVPGFVESSHFQAGPEVSRAQDTGGAGVRPLLEASYTRFPQSPVVTYQHANFQQRLADFAQALRFYDETLVLRPLHENALIGRTVSLTFLQRHDDAIAEASRMIDLRTVNVHEAYYWRAWNLYVRKDLASARADIERAKAIESSGDIHRLAGVIEHDQDDLDIAERDLVRAKSPFLGGQNDCTARWYLGLVGIKRSRWSDAGAHFEDAMACYRRVTIAVEEKLAAANANAELEPAFKAKLIERLTTAVTEGHSQFHAAAFNAANTFAAAGNLARARPLLEVAAKDPALDKVVADLRRRMAGGQRRRETHRRFWQNMNPHGYLRTF